MSDIDATNSETLEEFEARQAKERAAFIAKKLPSLQAKEKELLDDLAKVRADIKRLTGKGSSSGKKAAVKKSGASAPKATHEQWAETMTTVLAADGPMDKSELAKKAKEILKITGSGAFTRTVEKLGREHTSFVLKGDQVSLAKA